MIVIMIINIIVSVAPTIFGIVCAVKESKICVKYCDIGLVKCRIFGVLTALGAFGIYALLLLVIGFLGSSNKTDYWSNIEHPKLIAAICIAGIPLTIVPYKIALKRCPQELRKRFLFDLICIGIGVLFKLQLALCLLMLYLFFKLLGIVGNIAFPFSEERVILLNGHIGYTCGGGMAYDTETHEYVFY